MNLQAEKLEIVRMILDSDDKTTIMEVKSLFEKGKKTKNLDKFYKGFQDGIREVKLSLDDNIELKDAKTWANKL